ncbi:hypothetical protein AB0G67_11250 [Streptomyces sp. NPDC021056]|jgi:hypothetical protein|uniref:hypothetical protein n=1 Tax=unclassified Streptomyces TaxID=2593676 RepID=UPI0033D63979
MPPLRFHDPGLDAHHFSGSMLVRCPRCDRIAHFERSAPPQPRVVCRSCGLCRPTNRCAWPKLWLRTETRHGTVSAYNLEHLDLLRRFVAADLRERAPWYEHGRKMTYIGRLPAWIKSAKNRTEVLRAIDRMRASVISG